MGTSLSSDLSSLCTPSELAILLADRLVLSFPDRFLGSLQVPISGRFVGSDVILPIVVESAVAALRESGAVTLTPRSPIGPFTTVESLWLSVDNPRPKLADGSPEAVLMKWLMTQPEQSGHLSDAIGNALIAGISPNPWHYLQHSVLAGMLHRGVCIERRHSVWMVFTKTSLALHDSLAESAVTQTAALLTSLSATRARLTTPERAMVASSVQRAIGESTDR
jgi:hypothetical protein